MLKLRPLSLLALSTAIAGCLAASPVRAVDEQLATLVEQTKAEYQPVTPDEVNEARDQLTRAAYDLEQFLVPGSGRGERWKQYLKWQGVQQNLAEGSEPDLGALRASLDRFRSGADGTQQPVFRRTATALENYIDLAAIVRASNQQAVIERQMDLLAKYLDRYDAEPSARARFEIERRLDFLAGIGRATELTAALRNRFNRPNVRAEISERLLSRLVSKSVDETKPVTDCILGTSIHGTGRTTGAVSLETVPSVDRAALVLHLTGVTQSETRGYNDPVVIRSSGTTPFTATKRIEIEDANFWNYPTRVSATTSTVTRSVKKQGGGLGSRLVEAIGEQKVAEKKPQSNYIAARHAEQRIADNLEEELLPKLQDARYEYEQQFKRPLEVRNATPRSIQFSTTDNSLNFDLLEAGRGELGADTSPTSAPAGHDVAVRLHETGVANLAAPILGGATLSQKTKDGKPKLSAELPKFLRDAIDKAREKGDEKSPEADEREFKPWSVTFRRQRPVTAEFADQLVKIRLHAARIEAGNDTYDGWDIVANYRLQVAGGELTLVREGEIEVFPSAFDPANGDNMTNRQVGLRGNLAKELNRQSDAGRGFPKQIELGTLDLPEQFAQQGPLFAEHATSDGGWLSLGWRLPD